MYKLRIAVIASAIFIICSAFFGDDTTILIQSTGTTITTTTTIAVALADWSTDSRWRVIQKHEEADCEIGTLFPDSSPRGNPFTSFWDDSHPCLIRTGSDVVQEGLHSIEYTADGGGLCLLANSCDPTDFDFTSGDFTAFCWMNPQMFPGSNRDCVYTNDTAPFSATGSGWSLCGDPTAKLKFLIDGAGLVTLTSDSILPLFTWSHVAAKTTSGTASFTINGVQDATTAVVGSPAAGNTQLAFGNIDGGLPGIWAGIYDECAIAATSISTADLCRIAVCGIDGTACKCQAASIFYLDAPRHVAFGGPIACSLPGCSKAAMD